MLRIPGKVSAKFNKALRKRAVIESLHVHYRKWLFYFVYFFRKYSHPSTESEPVCLIIEKIKPKKQTPQQNTQGAHAISLFFAQKPRNGVHPSDFEEKSAPPARLEHGPSESHIANINAGNIISCLVQPVASLAEPAPSCNQPGGKYFNEWRCLDIKNQRHGTRLLKGLLRKSKSDTIRERR